MGIKKHLKKKKKKKKKKEKEKEKVDVYTNHQLQKYH